MNADQMRDHCLQFAALYAFLQQDTAHRKHDPDAHNLCGAVIENRGAGTSETLFSYSNPSALKGAAYEGYDFVLGSGNSLNIINRGGMQDLHTEVRLLNALYGANKFFNGAEISFFSSRSVCPTCRAAIYSVMQKTNGQVAIMAYEFKVEKFGSMTENVYPILMADSRIEQAQMPWQ